MFVSTILTNKMQKIFHFQLDINLLIPAFDLSRLITQEFILIFDLFRGPLIQT